MPQPPLRTPNVLSHTPHPVPLTRRAYRLFRQDPNHRSLRFKPVHPTQPIFSVRITGGYRAVGVRTGEEIVWYWIGTHAAYERLLAQRRSTA